MFLSKNAAEIQFSFKAQILNQNWFKIFDKKRQNIKLFKFFKTFFILKHLLILYYNKRWQIDYIILYTPFFQFSYISFKQKLFYLNLPGDGAVCLGIDRRCRQARSPLGTLLIFF